MLLKQEFSVLAVRTWRLADLSAKHALLREGIWWGNMPLPMVQSDLANGVLLRLDLPEDRSGIYRFDVIRRCDTALGPAGIWLQKQFIEAGLPDIGEMGAADV